MLLEADLSMYFYLQIFLLFTNFLFEKHGLLEIRENVRVIITRKTQAQKSLNSLQNINKAVTICILKN